jgi:TonB family protein
MMNRTLVFTLFFLLAAPIAALAAETPRARALSIPKPTKLPEASRLHLAGSGIFFLRVDKSTGRVTSIAVEKSTGQPLLDQSAIETFKKWRFAPGSVQQVRVGLTFTASSDGGQYR